MIDGWDIGTEKLESCGDFDYDYDEMLAVLQDSSLRLPTQDELDDLHSKGLIELDPIIIGILMLYSHY